MSLNPDEIPADLPEHPEETKLRKAENELARSLRRVSRDAVAALERHDRITAAVSLAGLAQMAAHSQKAMVRAIEDQMALAGPQEADDVPDPE